MNVDDLCNGILDALEDFDESIPPLGLYACDDLGGKSRSPQGYEWSRCLAPHFQKQGCLAVGKEPFNKILFETPQIGFTQLRIVRLSKIKVRKFGENYQMDKHRNYSERWDEMAIEKRLASLWNEQSDTISLRLLLFIGFDKTPTPFGGALFELQQSAKWEEHNVEYFTRTWLDRYNRHLGVRLSLWAHDEKSSTR